MAKNITLKLDEDVLKLCRYEAVEADKSLSQWVADVLTDRVRTADAYQEAKERAIRRLGKGMKLGGAPLDRDALHGR